MKSFFLHTLKTSVATLALFVIIFWTSTTPVPVGEERHWLLWINPDAQQAGDMILGKIK